MMASMVKIEREDGGPDLYRCDNCGRVWMFEQLDNIQSYSERVTAGGEVPAGECPDPDETCGGALCYPVPAATVPELTAFVGAHVERDEPTLAHVIDVLSRVRVVMDEQRDENGETFRQGNADLYAEVQALEGFARDCAMTGGELVLRQGGA